MQSINTLSNLPEKLFLVWPSSSCTLYSFQISRKSKTLCIPFPEVDILLFNHWFEMCIDIAIIRLIVQYYFMTKLLPYCKCQISQDIQSLGMKILNNKTRAYFQAWNQSTTDTILLMCDFDFDSFLKSRPYSTLIL